MMTWWATVTHICSCAWVSDIRVCRSAVPDRIRLKVDSAGVKHTKLNITIRSLFYEYWAVSFDEHPHHPHLPTTFSRQPDSVQIGSVLNLVNNFSFLRLIDHQSLLFYKSFLAFFSPHNINGRPIFGRMNIALKTLRVDWPRIIRI